MDVFSDHVKGGDILRASTYQNLLNFARGSSVAGGVLSADGISVPSEYERSPRIVRFIAEEEIASYTIIQLTEQINEGDVANNVVPTFKAVPATGDSGTLFYTATSFAPVGVSGIAYSLGGEPIQIRSAAEGDGSPQEGEIVEASGGAFRYLGKAASPDLRWFLPILGGTASAPSAKIRIVQPKELFPACEYKSIQNVFGCRLEYSDDGQSWMSAGTFDIQDGRMEVSSDGQSSPLNLPPNPHKHWRLNLKGTSKNDPEDKGFPSFGRLWDAKFWFSGESEPRYTFSEDETVESLPFESKPLKRGVTEPRYWTHTFDQPEVVTGVLFNVDRHHEHYIVCPGGRDENKQTLSHLYSFDLAAEKWTATTFPEMQKPMFNMDAKIVELADQTHQLVVLSGCVDNGFSNIIQGYNFEKDYVQNAVDMGEGAINFAGRPALWGDPMVRSVNTAVQYPSGESDFARSLIVVGGSEKSCNLDVQATSVLDSVLFSVQGATLATGKPYRIQTQNMAMSNVGHTGLPYGFFDYKTYSSQAGLVGTRLSNIAKYSRHQNLPVRGILRRRPKGDTSAPSSSNTIVDFLLLGGFNSVGYEEHNKSVVSGAFIAMTWSITGQRTQTYYQLAVNPLTSSWDSMSNRLLYYPDCNKVLGDCCAEYVEEWDELICFGGRSSESDTATAHAQLAVLKFDQNSNVSAAWHYGGNGMQQYPDMPHPRWSAASVLIKDLVRKGETEPCCRIFIIGGRNADGFVAEIDVFNLRYKRWESDWKGLLDGELENYTPSDGGKMTVINIGGSGSGGVQSVKAGEGVSVTGDSKNPTVGIDVQSIVQQLIQSQEFKNALIQALSQDSSLIQNITNSVITNQTFLTNVANQILQNEEIFSKIVESVVSNVNLINNIVQKVVNDSTFLTNIANQILQNEEVLNNIVNSVVNNEPLIENIVQNIVSNPTLLTNITNEILQNTVIITQIINNVTESVVNNEYLVENIVQNFVNNPTFQTNIANEILQNKEVFDQIVNNVVNNESIITNLAQNIVGDSTFITNITNEILTESAILEQVVSEVIDSIINNEILVNTIVQQVIYLPIFQDNITNGIVHHMLDQIVLLDPQKQPIAENNNGILTVQQAMPHQCGVVKCSKICTCYPQKLSLKSMDGMLEAITRHETHLFFPMVFVDKMPHRIQLFDKLTFFDENSSKEASCSCKTYTQDFAMMIFDPEKDFTQNFGFSVIVADEPPEGNGCDCGQCHCCCCKDKGKCSPDDYTQNFGFTVIGSEDYSQNFGFSVLNPGDYMQDFGLTVVGSADYTQDFGISVIEPDDYAQDFGVTIVAPEDYVQNFGFTVTESRDYLQNFGFTVVNPDDYTQDWILNITSPDDYIQDFTVTIIDPTKTYTQDFVLKAVALGNYTQDFLIRVYHPDPHYTQDFDFEVHDPADDHVQNFEFEVHDPANDYTQDFEIVVMPNYALIYNETQIAGFLQSDSRFHCYIAGRRCSQAPLLYDEKGQPLITDPENVSDVQCDWSCGFCPKYKKLCSYGFTYETCSEECLAMTESPMGPYVTLGGFCTIKKAWCEYATWSEDNVTGELRQYFNSMDSYHCLYACEICPFSAPLGGTCPYKLHFLICGKRCLKCNIVASANTVWCKYSGFVPFPQCKARCLHYIFPNP